MRREVKFVALFVCAMLVAQLQPAPKAAADSIDLTLTQTIRPLQCTVDVIEDGPVVTVRLLPQKCEHSEHARYLRDKIRHEHTQHPHGVRAY